MIAAEHSDRRHAVKVLLTGPFGTIGLQVLAELLRRQHDITCFDLDNKVNRKQAKRYAGKVSLHWGDITDPASVLSAVRGQDAVIHLAAMIPPMSDERPELAEKVNVQGTRHVIDAIAAQPTPPLFEFPSSISVHGWSEGRDAPCRVDTPMEAMDVYAGHKIACEEMIRASTIPWVIFRIGACTAADSMDKGGSDQKAAMARMFSVNPDTRLEYLHPLDAALAFVNGLDNRKAVEGKTLFLGSGAHSQLSWRTFINTVPVALGLGELPVEAFDRDPYYTDWMDTEESQRLLQFQRHGYPRYCDEVNAKWRWIRPVVTPFRGLVRRLMLSNSAAWQAHRQRGR
jgi:nucleoside-diphosphate-sugar epimerase